jgi:phage recombination protein Bet
MADLARVEEKRLALSDDRVELIKRTICPKGIGSDEFRVFIVQCERSGLDPLLKEAFCVPRKLNIGTQQRPEWVTRYEFQPSEAGMLGRAEQFDDFRGVTAQAVYTDDEVKISAGKGEVHHVFNPAKQRGTLVGAWGRVVKEGHAFPVVVWLDLVGYIQDSPLWRKMPATMMEKCARMAALRKAYPKAFGGLYSAEEVPPEGAEEEAPSAEPESAEDAAAPAVSRTEELKADLRAKAPLPKVGFGPCKGRPIVGLSLEELDDTIRIGEEDLERNPTSSYAKTMRKHVEALKAEKASRGAELQGVANG